MTSQWRVVEASGPGRGDLLLSIKTGSSSESGPLMRTRPLHIRLRSPYGNLWRLVCLRVCVCWREVCVYVRADRWETEIEDCSFVVKENKLWVPDRRPGNPTRW